MYVATAVKPGVSFVLRALFKCLEKCPRDLRLNKRLEMTKVDEGFRVLRPTAPRILSCVG